MSRKTKKWLAEQRATIGGNAAATIAGKNRFQTPRELAEIMLGKRDAPDLSDNPDVQRGLALEHLARQRSVVKVGHAPIRRHDPNQFLYNDEYPWAHALPDSLIEPLNELQEIKVPRPKRFYETVLRGAPEDWQVQCQHTLAVVGHVRMHLTVMCPVTLVVENIPIVRNQALIDDLMALEREFFGRIERGELPPETEEQAHTLEPLSVPKHSGGTLAIIETDEMRRAAETFLVNRELLEEATALVDEAKAKLISLADDADAFEIPNVLRCFFRIQRARRTFNLTKALEKHPDLNSDEFFKVGLPFRSFKPYDLRGKENA